MNDSFEELVRVAQHEADVRAANRPATRSAFASQVIVIHEVRPADAFRAGLFAGLGWAVATFIVVMIGLAVLFVLCAALGIRLWFMGK